MAGRQQRTLAFPTFAECYCAFMPNQLISRYPVNPRHDMAVRRPIVVAEREGPNGSTERLLCTVEHTGPHAWPVLEYADSPVVLPEAEADLVESGSIADVADADSTVDAETIPVVVVESTIVDVLETGVPDADAALPDAEGSAPSADPEMQILGAVDAETVLMDAPADTALDAPPTSVAAVLVDAQAVADLTATNDAGQHAPLIVDGDAGEALPPSNAHTVDASEDAGMALTELQEKAADAANTLHAPDVAGPADEADAPTLAAIAPAALPSATVPEQHDPRHTSDLAHEAAGTDPEPVADAAPLAHDPTLPPARASAVTTAVADEALREQALDDATAAVDIAPRAPVAENAPAALSAAGVDEHVEQAFSGADGGVRSATAGAGMDVAGVSGDDGSAADEQLAADVGDADADEDGDSGVEDERSRDS